MAMAIATLCVLHTDPAQAQTVSISSTALFVTEGRTANIAVTITPASASPLTIRYTLGTDADADTADADSADYTASNSLPIAARASSGVIAIPITDDAVAEPSREVFTITLDEPGRRAGYTLGSSITATVVIVVIDGVCARTMQVRNWIVGKIRGVDNCAAVTAEHLADISGSMDLRRHGIGALQEGDFLGLSVGYLYLSYNRLESLPAGVFSGLSVGNTLSLYNNRLESLPAGVFSGLSVDGSLSLSNNRLESLPAGVFSGLSVGYLGLDNNGLESLPAGVFSGLSVDGSLYLSYNRLETLPAGVFSGLSVGNILSLENNRLESLPAGVFSGLSVGNTLRLSHNRLESLPAGVFSDLIVGTLNLSGNELERLPAGAFSDLIVGTLNLDNNELESLPAGVFSDLIVGTLNLDNNELESLPAGIFSGLSVDALNLDNNQLETLPAEVFSGLSVDALNLDNNQLETLPAGIFSGLIVSDELRLDNNPGAPFSLTVELERTGGPPTASSPARVILKLIEGAPFEIPVPLAVSSGGALSLSRVTLVAGSAASDPFMVTGSGEVSVALGDLPPLPIDHPGLQLVRGAPLVLFGSATTGPGITSATITSVPASDQTYAAGESIEVTLTFDRVVTVDATGGRPGLSLQVSEGMRDALYVSGRGTTALVFRYRVLEGDMDRDGISWSASALGLNGGSLADRSGNAAVLTLNAQAAAAAHKVAAPPLEVSLGSPIYIVKEGETTDIIVNVTPEPASALTIHYTLGTDMSVDTDDANNADYIDSSSLRIAAGASHGVIAIAIVDDGMVEPSREVFTITLDTPESSARYTLGSLITATVTIVVIDGVCDRTMQVRDWIVGQIPGVDNCAAVTAGHLADISADMELGRRGISALQEGDFLGLSVGHLSLYNNELESLPAGVFSGLSVSRNLRLDNNQLESLPAGVFSGLSISGSLYLYSNELESLPAGVFSGLSISGSLFLYSNELESLPAGIFSGLSVRSLYLSNNRLESLSAGVFSGLSISGALYLYSNELESLSAGVFSGLSVGTLHLSNNQLESLPAGVFSGLSVDILYLHENPGVPFPLTVELERMDGSPTATAPAEVILKLVDGAPFEISVPLAVSSGGTLSSSRATLVAGSTASESFMVTGSGVVTVTLGALPPLPSGHQGLQLVGSAPLVLFGSATTRPGITSAAITSVPASDQTYAAGESIEVTLTFDGVVTVDATGGRPGLSLQVGTVTRDALYVSGRGTTALVFRYRVQDGDMDRDGISWSASALGLNGGSLADRSGNAAVLTLNAQASAAAHKVVAPLLEVALDSPTHIVKEGETTALTVTVTPEPASALTIHYTLGTDVSVDTDDANNADYIDSNSLKIAAGASHGVIAIAIVDDGMVEPSPEVFTITLDQPESPARYTLGSLITATVTIVVIDGVCDRTMQVRDWIVEQIPGVDNCAAVTAEHLADISADMELGRRGISTLQEDDFLGLSIGNLFLHNNELESLPVGVFSGLSVGTLNLSGNELESLPAGVFSGFIVGTLNLSGNELDSLPAGIFSGLSVGTLNLSGNELESLPAGIFSDFIVGTLNLDNNELESLPAGIFSGLSVDVLYLDNNELESLPAGIFSGLSVVALYLDNNELESLPAGIFSGLSVSDELRLDNNPGAPFSLTVEQERMDDSPTAASPARLILKLIEGAPFEIPVPLAVSSGSALSPSQATLLAGSTASEPFMVTGSSAVTVTLGALPPLPSGYQGLQLVRGASLVLFESETTGPGITSATITSVPASDQTYAAGESIEVMLAFDEVVTVDATGGRPGLSLQVGTVTRDALYVSGRGTTALVFRYRVQEGDMDSDGISWSASALGLNGGSLADRSGNAAVLTLNARVAAAAHKVAAPPLEVALGSPIYIVKEGETTDITVIVTPVPASALTIHYTLGTDVSVDTDDANNADYIDSNSLKIAAGASHGVIAIAIVDDGMAEPSREVFTITLDKPESTARYMLGSLIMATVTIVVIDGVCDRTMQVRDWIVEQIPGVDNCAAVTAEHLAGISGNMSLRGISALQEGDFLGLSVDSLDLSDNELETLPTGVFSGLSVDGSLDLSDNRLESLPAGVFSGLSVDGSLNLFNNRLQTLPAGVFSSLSIDGILYLSRNRLETLPAGVFSGLRLSERLSLSNNELETLPAGVFSGLSVRDLYLYNNQLESLPAGAFSGLSVGGSLALYNNRLETLPAGVFSGLSVRDLFLYNNQLERLLAGVFSGLRVGKILNLDRNPGRPFPLTVELERVDGPLAATGPAEVILKLVEGTPFEIPVPLAVSSGGTLSSSRATLVAGSTASEPFMVTGSSVVTVTLGVLPRLPSGYHGVRLVGSAPLVLFGSATTGPGITSAAITSAPAGDQTYAAGESIEVTLVFDEAVAVDATAGRPGLSLQVGTVTRDALYVSGRGTTALVFRYQVLEGDMDSDGISWSATALGLNGGSLADRSGTAAVLALDAQAAAAAHKVAAPPLEVSFGADGYTAFECSLEACGANIADVVVQLDRQPVSSVRIPLRYTLTGGAVGEDYLASTSAAADGSFVVIRARQTEGRVRVHALVDEVAEVGEGVEIAFGEASAYVVVAPTTTTVRLRDLWRVEFAEAVDTAVESVSQRTVEIQFTPALGVSDRLQIEFSATGTAGGEDYSFGTGLVRGTAPDYTFYLSGPGERITLPIVITADQEDEPDETLILRLVPDPAYALGEVTAHTLTIEDDDPLVGFADTSTSAMEGDTVQVVVEAATAPTRDLVLSYGLQGSDGLADTDFLVAGDGTLSAGSGTVIIQAETTQGEISLQLLDDEIDELDEVLTLTLLEMPGHTVDDTRHSVIIEGVLPEVSFATAALAVTEGGAEGVVRVNVQRFPSTDLSVIVQLSGAALDTDYGLTGLTDMGDTYTLKILGGAGYAVFSVTPRVDDEELQSAVMVLFTLQGMDDYGVSETLHEHEVTVHDNDYTVEILAPAPVAEDAGTVSVEVRVSGTTAPPGTITVPYTLVAGTATADGDYAVPESTSLEFLVGDFSGGIASQLITVSVGDDQAHEGDEEFTILLESPVSAEGSFHLAESQATVTIQDNDQRPDVFALEVSPGSVVEFAESTVVTVTLTLQDTTLNVDTEFALTLGGVATKGVDYALAGTLTVTVPAELSAGSVQLSLIPIQDREVEPVETIQFTAAADGFADQTGSLELTDDDISLSLSADTLSESAETTAVTVTATLGSPASTDITLTLALGGTANREGPAADYSVAVLPTLRIDRGQTTGEAVVTLNLTDDSIAEGAETITVTGTADNGFTVVEVPELALEDDDTAPIEITLGVVPDRLTEGSGEIPIMVTAMLGDGSVSLPEALSIPLSLGGTAGSPEDYRLIGDDTITIAGGATTATTTLQITPLRDEQLEEETIVVDSVLAGYTVLPATIALQDPGFTVTAIAAGLSITEGREVRVEVTVASSGSRLDPQGTVTVLYALEDDTTRTGADYAVPSGELLFAVTDFSGGTATRFISIRTHDDVVDEEDEQFMVTLQNPSGAAGDRFSLGSQFRTTVTVQDNDAPPDAFTLTVSPARIAESAGETAVTVTVTLQGTSFPKDTEFTLLLKGALIQGTDYTLRGPGTVTVPKEGLGGSVQLYVTPIQDTIVEPTGFIDFTATADDFTDLQVSSMELTDDDIGLSLSPDTLSESAGTTAVTVTATLGSPASTDIALTLTLRGTANPGGVDYSAATLPVLSITDGATTGMAVISLTPVDDSIMEGTKSITVTATADNGFTVVNMPELALEDDETAPSAITLRVTPDQLTEGSGAIAVTVTATLGRGSVSLSEALTIPLILADEAGVSGDYTFSGTLSITIDAGATIGMTTLQITPLADEQLEAETIEVRGTLEGYTVTPASITLQDPGFAATVAAAAISVAEGEAARVGVTVASSSSVSPRGDVTVSYALANGTTRTGADYATPSGRLLFAVGDFSGATATKFISILTSDDVVNEGNEQFTVILEPPTGAAGDRFSLGGQFRTTVTVQDNDARPDAFTLMVSPDSIVESAGETTVTVTVTLTDTSLPVSTDFTLGVSGMEGTDYDLTGVRAVTVPAESVTGSTQLDLSPTQDMMVEPTRTIQFTAAADGFDDQMESLQLTDDDLSLELDRTMLVESASQTAITVTATLGSPASTNIDLTLALGGTANPSGPAADYSAAALPVLSIAGGQTTGMAIITLTPIDDSIAEGPETITVTGTANHGFTVVNVPELALQDNDAAPTEITLEVAPDQLTEGAGETPVTVTATLGDGSVSLPEALVIPLRLAGTADFPEDYTLAGTTPRTIALTIAEGATTGATTLRIIPLRDSQLENEMIMVGSPLTDYTVTPATIVLQDAGATFTVAVPATVQTVENAGAASVPITISGSTAPQGLVTVPWTLMAGTAMENEDYRTASGEVRFDVQDFSAGMATRAISIPVTNDTVHEDDESFTVLLQTPVGETVDQFNLGQSSSVVTIRNDDPKPALFALEVSPGRVEESASVAELTITVSWLTGTSLPADTAFSLALGGVATEGTDYTLSGVHTLTIPARLLTGSATLQLRPIQDTRVEGAETIEFIATAPGFTNAGTAFAILTDDDIGLALSPDLLAESAGQTEITVKATLGSPASTSIDLTLALGGTAHREDPVADYSTAAALPALRIEEGSMVGTAVINLTPVDDELVEGAEFITVAGTASGGFTVVDVAALLLQDNDVATQPVLTLQADPVLLTEGSGRTDIVVRAVLDAPVLSGPLTIPLTLGGTADEATDYEITGTRSITIADSGTMGMTTLQITPLSDSDSEAEQIQLGSTLSGYIVRPVLIALRDAAIVVSVPAVLSIAEAAGAVDIPVTLLGSAAPQGAVTVRYTLAGKTATAGADYTASAASVLGSLIFTVGDFSGGSATKLISIPVLSDVVHEGDESFTVTLHTPVGAAGDHFTLGQSSTTVTISDDDARPDAFTLMVSPDRIAESAAAATVLEVIVELIGTSLPEDTEFALTVRGAAMEGADYRLSGMRTVTVPAGQPRGSVMLMLQPIQDTLVEGDETITLVAEAPDFVNPGTALALLSDDDIGLELSPTRLVESAGATFVAVTATLGGSAVADIDLTLRLGGTADGDGEDYDTGVLPTLRIARGESSGMANIELTPVNDAVPEGMETITIEGTASNGFTVVDVPELTLLDDSAASASVLTLQVDPAVLTEGAAETLVTVTAHRAGPAPALTIPLSLGGTADESGDYRITGTRSITIADRATTGMTTLQITPLRDTVLETETIELSSALTSPTVLPATITLRDASFVVAAPVALRATEDMGTVSVRVMITGTVSPQGGILIPYTLTAGTARAGADYQAASGFLRFAVADFSTGMASKNISIPIINDTVHEDDEHFMVTLDNPVVAAGDLFIVEQSSTTVTITDNDRRPDIFVLTVSPGHVAESTGATTVTTTVTLVTGTSLPEPTAFSLQLGGTATAGMDYILTGARTVTVLAERLSGNVELSLQLLQDSTVEGPETLEFTAVAEGFTSRTMLALLTDDDISLALNLITLDESAGATQVVVTAMLGSSAATDVDLSLMLGGTADAPADYGVDPDPPPTLRIARGSNVGRAVLELTPVDDGTVEGVETITVIGSTSGYTVVDVPALQLRDNDAAAFTVAVPAALPVAEGEGTVAVPVTITGAASPQGAVSVRYTLAGGSATAGADYTAPASGTLNFAVTSFTNGRAQQHIMVDIADDTEAENNETFMIVLQSAVGVTGDRFTLGQSVTTVTITDNDGTLNRPPVVAGILGELTLATGAMHTVDIADAFSDADRADVLRYSATSSAPDIATVPEGFVAASMLTVTAVAVGTSTITVTAEDSGGLMASQPFMVTVVDDTTGPVVTAVAITSDPGEDNTYVAGDEITVAVTFDEPLVVEGTPRLQLHFAVGDKFIPEQNLAHADSYASSGAVLRFRYRIEPNKNFLGSPGVIFYTNAMNDPLNNVKDAVGNPASLSIRSVLIANDFFVGHDVDTVAPDVTGVTFGSAPDVDRIGIASSRGDVANDLIYVTDDVIHVHVLFDDPVRLEGGSPVLMLDISAGRQVAADYDADSNVDDGRLSFAYTVQATDVDRDGINITPDALQLAGTSLTDIPGNPVATSLSISFDEATPRINTINFGADNVVDARDVKLFYYALVFPALGDGSADDGDAAMRRNILGPLAPPGSNDAVLLRILRAAHDLNERQVAMLDINDDGVVDDADAGALYYAFALPAALGDGARDSGIAGMRRAILGPSASNPNDDEELRAMLRKAHKL